VTGRSLLLVCTLALLWGSSFSFMKLAVETIPPVTVAAARAFLGGILLFAVMGRSAPTLWRSNVPFPTYFAQAAFNCFIPWTLLMWASTTIDSTLVTVLNSLSPIFTFLIVWGVTRHEAVTGRKFVGVLLGIAGVIVIVGVDALTGIGKHTLAELACVTASGSYAIAAVLGRRFEKLSPLVPAAGSTLVASVVLIPMALVLEQPWTAAPSMRSLLGLGGLVVFATFLAFIVYFRLLSTIGSIGTTAQAYLRIIVGVAIGVTFLGERLTPNLVAGVVLVVAGVIAMTMPGRKRAT